MTTRERKEYLKKETVKKYERLKFKAGELHRRREISDDDYRMRKKFLTREANIRLAEIDEMSVEEAKIEYKAVKKTEIPE